MLPVKDEENQQVIPEVWRPFFCEIVKAFVAKDYYVKSGSKEISKISDKTAKQIESYIKDYGEELIELPEETWNTSVCIWAGNGWDVIIDLWTKSEGQSDMILSAKVTEENGRYKINVYMVYVP